MSLLLSPEERRKFADYCQREADTYEQMSKAVEGNPVFAVIIKRNKLLIAAYSIVAKELNSVEDFSIGTKL